MSEDEIVFPEGRLIDMDESRSVFSYRIGSVTCPDDMPFDLYSSVVFLFSLNSRKRIASTRTCIPVAIPNPEDGHLVAKP